MLLAFWFKLEKENLLQNLLTFSDAQAPEHRFLFKSLMILIRFLFESLIILIRFLFKSLIISIRFLFKIFDDIDCLIFDLG